MFAKYTKLIVRDPSTGSLVQILPEVKTATEVDAESSLPVTSSAVASWGEAFVRKESESETISGDVTFEGRTTYSDDIAMSGHKIVDPSGIELSPSSNTDNNGGYIDFRYNNAEESTSRIIESASGTVTINNVNISNGSVSAATFTGALNGNAATTTKLATARTINGASFDGTGNITTTNWGTARNISISDSDGTNTGAAVSVNGSGNATLKLPATIKASITGNCSGSSGSCTGNAATATKLATARAINGTNFDGSAAITTANWGTARNIYVSDSDGTNTGTAVSVNGSANATLKLPATIKAGITGNASTATKLATARNINGTSFDGSAAITTANWGTARNISISDSDGTNTGTAVSVNGSGNATLKLPGTIKASITGNVSGSSGSCTGNAATATKLATTRSLWGNNFDGSAAISGTINGTPSIEFKPTATTSNNGGYLDFHYNQSTADYTSRIIESASGTLSINNVTITTGKVVTATTFTGALSGNASTATKLATARTIGISGGATGTATSFDGSANITIPVTALDVSKASAGTLAVARGGTGLASLDTFVRTTGNQTIAGTKTFSAEIMVNKGDKPAGGALSHVFGVTYQNTGGTQTHTAHPISVIGNSNADNNYNTGVRLGSLNGTTVVSAGESGAAFCTKLSKFDDENLYLDADGEVHVYVKCANDMATYAGPIKLSGSGNASGGTTSITATTFIGALTGNVTGNCSGSSGSCTGNAATATKIQRASEGTTYVAAVTAGKSLINSTTSSFGTVWNAPTKNYRVGVATYPSNNDQILWYSVTNANVSAGTNTVNKSMYWDAGTGVLTATGFAGPLTGNAATATKLATARTINGVSFDGSANITVADSTKLPLAGGTVTGATYFTAEYYRKDTGAVKGTAPSANRWQNGVRFIDNNNVAFGGIERGFLTDKTNRVNMIVYKGTTTDTSTNSQIGVGFDKDGNWFTYAPTPAAADNSTKIATTAWVRGRLHISTANPSGGTDGDIWFKYA